jgi:hypothetical protein
MTERSHPITQGEYSPLNLDTFLQVIKSLPEDLHLHLTLRVISHHVNNVLGERISWTRRFLKNRKCTNSLKKAIWLANSEIGPWQTAGHYPHLGQLVFWISNKPETNDNVIIQALGDDLMDSWTTIDSEGNVSAVQVRKVMVYSIIQLLKTKTYEGLSGHPSQHIALSLKRFFMNLQPQEVLMVRRFLEVGGLSEEITSLLKGFVGISCDRLSTTGGHQLQCCDGKGRCLTSGCTAATLEIISAIAEDHHIVTLCPLIFIRPTEGILEIHGLSEQEVSIFTFNWRVRPLSGPSTTVTTQEVPSGEIYSPSCVSKDHIPCCRNCLSYLL